MAAKFRNSRLSVAEYAEGILQGNRVVLSQAITLVESKLSSDNALAGEVIDKIIPNSGNSLRIGITGVPGVGKSTFIEVFGQYLVNRGKRIAVLTIDPSSQRSKGSILGDKTRMERLANDPNAYIRPTASGSTLGGVHSKTRETILLCEAAGYDVILVETVGVGQSETSVKDIVDFFLLLMLANAGDELQGIKRGIMEMADAITINKADGENMRASNIAKLEYKNALHLFPANPNGWMPEVLTCSATENTGIEEIWELILRFEKLTKENGSFDNNRKEQNLGWMEEAIKYHLETNFYEHEAIAAALDGIRSQVSQRELPALTGARKLLDLFNGR